MEAVLKTAALIFRAVGSNPTPSAINLLTDGDNESFVFSSISYLLSNQAGGFLFDVIFHVKPADPGIL